MTRQSLQVASLLLLLTTPSMVTKAQDDGAWAKKKSGWLLLSASDRGQVREFAEDSQIRI